MSLNHYYQSELTALRQLGKRFSERNPALAPFLGQRGRDPDVERLLEGFAFLTGRLRQKLDDQLPELTHSLMQLLWPNFMRPLPAFSMLQFDPTTVSGPAQIIPRHTDVMSQPVQGVNCRFLTAFETEVFPLKLDALHYTSDGNGAVMTLRLTMTAEGHIGDLDLKKLRLHLAGEPYISQQLYLSLNRHLSDVQLTLLDKENAPLTNIDNEPARQRLGPDHITPVGFAEEEALLPYPLNTFRGYRYLQEYFAFPEKFLFVDLTAPELTRHQPPELVEKARGIEVRFNFNTAPEQRIQPTLENVLLYCTPITNLFKHDASPIRLDGKEDRYLVMPKENKNAHYAVFSVNKVSGWNLEQGGDIDYVLFESFEHDASFDVPTAKPYYSIHQETSPLDNGLNTYLSFSTRDHEKTQTVSLELTCTNQNLARELKEGDICLPGIGAPGLLSFRNISPVTPSYPPPLHRDYLWKLISNMSLNYLSLANVDALKVILETYDLPGYYDPQAENISRKRLAGLKHIRHSRADRLYRGLPVRGVCTHLTVDAEAYRDKGELFLFASVLNEFFALYTSLNSFHQLQVESAQGERYEWTPRMGQQSLL